MGGDIIGHCRRLLARGRGFLFLPKLALLVALALVVATLVHGDNRSLYWVYPLLVALPALLKTRTATWLAALLGAAVIPVVWMRFDVSTAIILTLSMACTWFISVRIMLAVSRQSSKLGELIITDPLTGAFNRRRLRIDARQAVQTWQRYRRPSTLLLLDVDHFKRVNDELGHDVGDRALRELASILQRRLRSLDSVYRYGGEEFVVLLVETDASQAAHVAEDLRAQVQSADIVPGRALTVSIGLCDVMEAESVEQWLGLCDKALYQAKQAGRNRVA